MNKTEQQIEILAKDFSANTYDFERIKQDLINLAEIAKIEGQIEAVKSSMKTNPTYTPEQVGLIGEHITEPEQVQPDYKGFEVGKVYKHISGELAYFCGLDEFGDFAFELLSEKHGCELIFHPIGWTSKAHNKYWCYLGIENLFDPTPINI